MSSEKIFHIGLKAVILNGRQEVLLLQVRHKQWKGKSNWWELPGGRINQGESEPQALQRELLEELGYQGEVESVSLGAVITDRDFSYDGVVIGLALIVVRCSCRDSLDVRLSDEHLSYEWVPIEEAKRRLRETFHEDLVALLDRACMLDACPT